MTKEEKRELESEEQIGSEDDNVESRFYYMYFSM